MFRPQEGSYFSPAAMCAGQRQRGQKDHFTSQHSPGAHYPESITHAQTALCRLFMLIELLNDVEAFKTNSVFSVWWLNDMDSQLVSILG